MHMKTIHNFVLRLALFMLVIASVTTFSVMVADDAFAGSFQRKEAKFNDISPFYKWKQVLARLPHISQEECVGGKCTNGQGETGWFQLVDAEHIRHSPPSLSMLDQVNQFINRIPYAEDQEVWGVNDYWATPEEFFARQKGDCEDFAIAKYVMLQYLGVNKENMRIVVMNDKKQQQIHAVLMVNIAGVNYILDNQSSQVLTDRVATALYEPIYSINEYHWWRHKA